MLWIIPLFVDIYKFMHVIYVGLWGPDPGSELVSQTNPYTTGPFSINLRSVDWSLTQSSMGGCWNQVSAPLR